MDTARVLARDVGASDQSYTAKDTILYA
ncbi:MAG: hypothetical protein RL367_2356, partial [Pseudomonadota bacterium]